jgi:hypothetical protein
MQGDVVSIHQVDRDRRVQGDRYGALRADALQLADSFGDQAGIGDHTEGGGIEFGGIGAETDQLVKLRTNAVQVAADIGETGADAG